MSKTKINSKSEAAIIGLLDDFEAEGLTPLEEDSIENIPQKNNSIEKKIRPNLQNKKPFIEQEKLIVVKTNLCKTWKYADRSDFEMGNIEDLADSIKKNGQQEPILIRKIEKDEKGRIYEIVFGFRRWKACDLIGQSVKAIVRSLSDQEAAICQKEENENRENLSDYSKAISYQKLLDQGVFSSSSELAARMNLPKATLSDLLSYTRIHPKILSAMPEPHKLTRKAAAKLASFSKNISEKHLTAAITLAPQINYGKISSNALKENIELLYSTQKNPLVEKVLVKNKDGISLFTLKSDLLGKKSIQLHDAVNKNISFESIKNIFQETLEEIIDKKLKKNSDITTTKMEFNDE